jgi:hypothetical protein
MTVEGDKVFVLMQDATYEQNWIVLGVYATEATAQRMVDLLRRASVTGELKIEPCELRA